MQRWDGRHWSLITLYTAKCGYQKTIRNKIQPSMSKFKLCSNLQTSHWGLRENPAFNDQAMESATGASWKNMCFHVFSLGWCSLVTKKLLGSNTLTVLETNKVLQGWKNGHKRQLNMFWKTSSPTSGRAQPEPFPLGSAEPVAQNGLQKKRASAGVVVWCCVTSCGPKFENSNLYIYTCKYFLNQKCKKPVGFCMGGWPTIPLVFFSKQKTMKT